MHIFLDFWQLKLKKSLKKVARQVTNVYTDYLHTSFCHKLSVNYSYLTMRFLNFKLGTLKGLSQMQIRVQDEHKETRVTPSTGIGIGITPIPAFWMVLESIK